eukprot:TRINITY_DN8131_c2_g1_i2.p1 TRINITY_DN8131_c2_g1~~TRINITY_DN8131_c2_g1_i2.p1  ORF type:complete len:869 (+),score=225.00 TRINITY_DN8131_c2_g1_i2:60-2609(+)
MAKVSVRSMIVLTGLISTLASLAGGLVLYFEGKSLIEKTVKELSQSDVSLMDTLLKNNMKKAEETAREVGGHLWALNSTDWDVHDWRNLAKWVAISTVKANSGFYSLGIFIVPKDIQSGEYVAEMAWYDKPQDKNLSYIYATGRPEIRQCMPGSAPPTEICINQFLLDDFADVGVSYDYNSSVVSSSLKVHHLNPTVDHWWNGQYTWVTLSNTSVWYAQFDYFPPNTVNTTFLADKEIVVTTYIDFYNWELDFGLLNTPADMVAVAWNSIDRESSTVLASNVRVPNACMPVLVQERSRRCVLNLSSFPESIGSAVGVIERSRDFGFRKVSVSGGQAWVRGSMLYSPIKTFDDTDNSLGEIALVWMRDVSDVEDQINSALYFFIVFLCIVVLFDIAMGLTEYFLLARPLSALSLATKLINSMELDDAEDVIRSVPLSLTCFTKHPFLQIQEVHHLTEGLRTAVKSLKEYKAFLPQSLFAVDAEQVKHKTMYHSVQASTAENPLQPPDKSGSDTSYNDGPATTLAMRLHSFSRSSSMTYTQRVSFSLSLETVRAAVLTIRLAHLDGGGPAKVGPVLSSLEAILQETRGVIHPIPTTALDTVTMSWNATAPCTGSSERAANTALRAKASIKYHFMSVSYGVCKAGYIGNKKQKAFCISGPLVVAAEGVGLSASELSVQLERPVIACCGTAQTVIRTNFKTVCIDVIKLIGNNSTTVWEILGAVGTSANQEWLYNEHFTATHPLETFFTKLLRTPASTALSTLVDTALEEAIAADPLVRHVMQRVRACYPNKYGACPLTLHRLAVLDDTSYGVLESTLPHRQEEVPNAVGAHSDSTDAPIHQERAAPSLQFQP